MLVGAVLSRPTQQVSPPAVAAGLEIEHEEPQSVENAFVHSRGEAPVRPIWREVELVVAAWC